MTSTYVIDKDQYKLIPFPRESFLRVRSNDPSKEAYFCMSKNESDIQLEEAQYLAAGHKPIRVGYSDIRILDYWKTPVNAQYGTTVGAQYVRAREAGITIEFEEPAES